MSIMKNYYNISTNTSLDDGGGAKNNIISSQKAVKTYVDSKDASSLYTINGYDAIYVYGSKDVEQYLNDNYSQPLFNLYSFVSLKPLTFQCSPYEWSESDPDGYQYADVLVNVIFPDNGKLTKTISFYRNDEALGVSLEDINSYVDTGLTLDYSFEFEAKGYVNIGKQGCFIDAFYDTTTRTSLRVLGVSNKVQHMWPSSNEFAYNVTNIDVTKPFTYIQKHNIITMRQNGVVFTKNISNATQYGTYNTPIIILNSSANSYTYGNCVLFHAIIRDSSGTVLRHFKPNYVDNTLCLVDIVNNNVYMPNQGAFLPVYV